MTTQANSFQDPILKKSIIKGVCGGGWQSGSNGRVPANHRYSYNWKKIKIKI
jgi:hypothetical protein